jgi:hypothetical protein
MEPLDRTQRAARADPSEEGRTQVPSFHHDDEAPYDKAPYDEGEGAAAYAEDDSTITAVPYASTSVTPLMNSVVS